LTKQVILVTFTGCNGRAYGRFKYLYI